MDIRKVLNSPALYQIFQRSGGFFGARLKSLERYLPLASAGVIVDVGCGPGSLRSYLPRTCRYIGYDTDQRYIDYARIHHAENAEYHCRIFDSSESLRVRPADVIMMNGLLHHLTDTEARALLQDAYAALAPGGRIFTLDGCYTVGQTRFRKTLLDWDRGEHVRTAEGYAGLFDETVGRVQHFVAEDLSWFPYSWICHVAAKET